MSPEEIRTLLCLRPHPEGGFFAETHRSEALLRPGDLGGGIHAARSLSTAIYYLLTPETFSAMHRLAGEELFHFYLGDPVEMLQLHPDGTGRIFLLGGDLAAGMRPQVVVPSGVWQGTRLLPGGRFALLGTTMAPGFDGVDYTAAERASLIETHPAYKERIERLTR